MFKKASTMLVFMFCLGLLISGGAQASSQAILKDMADFDKVFIPSLSLTNKNAVGPSTKAIKAVKEKWAAFTAKYAKAMPNDSDWAGDLEMGKEAIGKAFMEITQNKDCDAAHNELEEVRFITLQMRTRNKLPYYLDLLNQYHEDMEPLIHSVDISKAKSWGEKELADIAKSAEVAKKSWASAAKARIDRDALGFSDQQVKKLKQAYKAGLDNFAALDNALASSDRAGIVKAIKRVKPHYKSAFKLFGDFKRFKK
jgi:hypothetical protein